MSEQNTFGAYLRALRTECGVSLRERLEHYRWSSATRANGNAVNELLGHIDALQAQVDGLKLLADIPAFVERVERRAENNKLKTGKLEGAHYAAIKAELKALAQSAQPEPKEDSINE